MGIFDVFKSLSSLMFHSFQVPQERQFTVARLALEFLHGEISNPETGHTSAAKRWLFPEPSDWDVQCASHPGSPPKMKWVDPELNSQQKVGFIATSALVYHCPTD
jgi:hypothetical protein